MKEVIESLCKLLLILIMGGLVVIASLMEERYMLFTLLFAPLIRFCRTGNVRMIKLLLKMGFDPNKHYNGLFSKDRWHETPLRVVVNADIS